MFSPRPPWNCEASAKTSEDRGTPFSSVSTNVSSCGLQFLAWKFSLPVTLARMAVVSLYLIES